MPNVCIENMTGICTKGLVQSTFSVAKVFSDVRQKHGRSVLGNRALRGLKKVPLIEYVQPKLLECLNK